MRRLNAQDVTHLFVHTAAFDGDCTAKQIREWHLARGWDDIGYHFVVRYDGTVEPGRELQYQGAHVAGMNARSIGICFSGHGDKRAFTPQQMEAGAKLCARLAFAYDIPITHILGHREVNALIREKRLAVKYATAKTCPGTQVDMSAFRAAVKEEYPPEPLPRVIRPSPTPPR